MRKVRDPITTPLEDFDPVVEAFHKAATEPTMAKYRKCDGGANIRVGQHLF